MVWCSPHIHHPAFVSCFINLLIYDFVIRIFNLRCGRFAFHHCHEQYPYEQHRPHDKKASQNESNRTPQRRYHPPPRPIDVIRELQSDKKDSKEPAETYYAVHYLSFLNAQDSHSATLIAGAGLEPATTSFEDAIGVTADRPEGVCHSSTLRHKSTLRRNAF